MANQLQLHIVTPDSEIIDAAASDVIVPAIKGELEVLPGHAPFLAQLGTGVLSFKPSGNYKVKGRDTASNNANNASAGGMVRLMVSGGFVEVDDTRVTLLCEIARTSADVDSTKEREIMLKLEQQLKALGAVDLDDTKAQELQTSIDRSAANLQLVN